MPVTLVASRVTTCRLALAAVGALALLSWQPVPAAAAGSVSLAHQDIRQSQGLDCEAAALVIALGARGIHVDEQWVMAQMPNDTRPPVTSGSDVIQWGDPYAAFVGDYHGGEPVLTGYGVYWPPVADAARAAGAVAVAASGWSPSVLFADVLSGHPAVVWVVSGYGAPATRWWTAWDGHRVPWVVGEHAVALVGVDLGRGTVLLANPWTGIDDTVAIPRFLASFGVFGNMAVEIGGGGGVAIGASPSGRGYSIAGADGSVTPFGDAPRLPDRAGQVLNEPLVGMAGTPAGHGYWLVAADGGIFPFGDAVGHGSTGGIHLNQPVVGMAATPTGHGYWLVAADGGIFPFGDAVGYGSTGGIHLNQPIVGMAATPSGHGYWLVAADGGIFPFGDAAGHGSTGRMQLSQPMVGMAATPSGRGYWLVAADGGIFPFGDATGHGSTAAMHLGRPVVGMARTPDGQGYWLVAADGGVFPFGDAIGYGSSA